MNRLSKKQIAERGNIAGRLSAARVDVDAAIIKYNEVLYDARDFASTITADAQSHYDDKSDKWQEGDRGTSYQDFINEWEGVELDDIDFDDVDDHAVKLEELPEEPSW